MQHEPLEKRLLSKVLLDFKVSRRRPYIKTYFRGALRSLLNIVTIIDHKNKVKLFSFLLNFEVNYYFMAKNVAMQQKVVT